MSDYFIGEIKLFAGCYAPSGWALCDGTLKQISQYQALFALIGTTYGGDGVSTFAVPNLQGSVAIGAGLSPDTANTTYTLGQMGGSETVPLTTAQAPAHTHVMSATTAQATTSVPGPTLGFASVESQALLAYTDVSKGISETTTDYGSSSVGATGNSVAHTNMMPSMPLTYIIALEGEYPFSG